MPEELVKMLNLALGREGLPPLIDSDARVSDFLTVLGFLVFVKSDWACISLTTEKNEELKAAVQKWMAQKEPAPFFEEKT